MLKNENPMRIYAIIPARGSSKRIHKKNVKSLLGKPLLTYSIEQAKSSLYIDKVFVSSEDSKILRLAKKNGANFIKRPLSLAQDHTSTEKVIKHTLVELKKKADFPTHVVILQPTSPLRYPEDIDRAILHLIKTKSDSLLSVCKNTRFIWSQNRRPLNYEINHRPRSQNKKSDFIENGSIYITSVSAFNKFKNRLGGKIVFYVQPPECGFEIDDYLDWDICQFLMKRYYKTNVHRFEQNFKQ